MRVCAFWAMIGLLLWAAPVRAVTLRYAIVIGNDRGVDTDGRQPFPDLLHAEQEAQKLHQKLIQFGNFDPSPDRTVLLTGTTRAELLDAVRRVADRMTQDKRGLVRTNTLFVLFFTGHGLSRRLLLNDGPLEADDLGGIFKIVQADVSIGVFDACYAGSLDRVALAEKGIRSTPGLNIFRELPEEVLNAEGSIWIVSSGPSESSYEDADLGGVFTHFFIDALENAPMDGPGITLDGIWHYVRNKTMKYTSLRGRQQVPQQYVARLKSTGPLYFSFPVERTAALVLDAPIQGHFLLSYAGGQLTEIIDKAAGARKTLSVYPGRADLMLLKDGNVYVQEGLSFSPGSTVVIHSSPDTPGASRPGLRSRKLWEKGSGGQTLVATARLPATSVMLGAGYAYGWSPRGTLASEHMPSVDLRLDSELFTFVFSAGYGTRSESFDRWSYRADGLTGGLRAGIAWDVGRVRLGALAGVKAGMLWQEYSDGNTREDWWIAPSGAIAGLVPLWGGLYLELHLDAGAVRSPGAGALADVSWQFQAGGGVTLYYRLDE